MELRIWNQSGVEDLEPKCGVPDLEAEWSAVFGSRVECRIWNQSGIQDLEPPVEFRIQNQSEVQDSESEWG